MKKYLLTLTFSLTITGLHAQFWTQQNSNTVNDMNAIGFAADNLSGWAFGDSAVAGIFQYGTIYKTVNQGFSWTEVDMGSDSIQILACHVFSPMNVIGVGKFQTTGDGAVIRTSNGGVTWDRDTTTVPERVFDVDFPTSTTGYIAGRNGYVGKTIDGGVTWTDVSTGGGEDLFAVSFVDANNGWVVGADGGSGAEIYATNDGGTSWTLQSNPSTGDLFGVDAVNADTIYAAGSAGQILFTGDGGATWALQTSGTAEDLFDVEFRSTIYGKAVGAGGTIVVTADAGSTWSTETSGTTNDIMDLYMSGVGIDWYCGGNGDIYIYSVTPPNTIEEASLLDAAIYPNPTNDNVYLELKGNESAHFSLCGLDGREVFRQNSINGKAVINLSELNSGAYIYVIINEANGTHKSGRLIKN